MFRSRAYPRRDNKYYSHKGQIIRAKYDNAPASDLSTEAKAKDTIKELLKRYPSVSNTLYPPFKYIRAANVPYKDLIENPLSIQYDQPLIEFDAANDPPDDSFYIRIYRPEGHSQYRSECTGTSTMNELRPLLSGRFESPYPP